MYDDDDDKKSIRDLFCDGHCVTTRIPENWHRAYTPYAHCLHWHATTRICRIETPISALTTEITHTSYKFVELLYIFIHQLVVAKNETYTNPKVYKGMSLSEAKLRNSLHTLYV